MEDEALESGYEEDVYVLFSILFSFVWINGIDEGDS